MTLENERYVATFYSAPGYTKFHAFCAESNVSQEEYAPIISIQDKINNNKAQK